MGNLIILTFICLLLECFEISANGENTYRAAVLEYSPTYSIGDTAAQIYQNSVADYVNYIEKASKQKVDIIVFPEDGLSGITVPDLRKDISTYSTPVPHPNEHISPCKSTLFSDKLLIKNISCAAAKNKIYVAVNLVEVSECSQGTDKKCPSDGVFYYNTNVVFNREGSIIARYRKFNLFLEPGFNVTDKPDITIFKTDFDVTFGMFICFDILFKSPALDLIREQNIHDIIYSTAWFSELPFLTAIQTQAGFAFGNDITLVAAGYNNPANKNGGSGIYVGRAGSIKSVFPLERKNTLLIADIPKYPLNKLHQIKKENPSDSKVFINEEIEFFQDDLRNYTTEIITSNSFNKKICHNSLCCSFNINIGSRNDVSYVYRVVVYDGVRSFIGLIDAGIQVCGVVNCLNDKIESCGLRNHTLETGVTFDNINIKGNFRQNENTFQWPAIINSRLLTYDPLTDFQYAKTAENIQLIFANNFKPNDLLTFAVYGRDYSLDQDHRQELLFK